MSEQTLNQSRMDPCKDQGRRRGTGTLLGWAALFAGLGAVAALQPALTRAKTFQPAYTLSEHEREEVNTSAFGLILGEARSSMADLLWVKTERYLHNGVAYMPHLSAAEMAHSGQAVLKPQATGADDDHEEAGEAGPEHHHHEGKLVALIPDRSHDYRGPIGTIQRAVQPYLPPGSTDEHHGGQELLPWYRLLTYSDPHHWRGYLIGAWWLVSQKDTDPQALAEAARFIDEGIRNNPGIYQLELMKGRIALQREAWAEAMAAFDRMIALAQKVRPADGHEDPPRWSLSDEEDYRAAVRYAPMIQLRKRHDLTAAQAAIARAQALLPRDGPLIHLKAEIEWERQHPGATQ